MPANNNTLISHYNEMRVLFVYWGLKVQGTGFWGEYFIFIKESAVLIIELADQDCGQLQLPSSQTADLFGGGPG